MQLQQISMIKKACLSSTFHPITEAHFGNWTIKPRKAPTLLSQQLHPHSQQSIIATQLKIKILLYRSPVSCTKKRPGFDANTAATSRHQMAQLNMFLFRILSVLVLIVFQGTQNIEEIYFSITILHFTTHHIGESVFVLFLYIF